MDSSPFEPGLTGSRSECLIQSAEIIINLSIVFVSTQEKGAKEH